MTEPPEFENIAVAVTSSAASSVAPSSPGAEKPYAAAGVGGIELRVTRDGVPTRRLRIHADRCTLGSGEGCTVRLGDASLRPLHAVILCELGQVQIRGCTDALEVNGHFAREALLALGDVFRLGNYRFELIGLPDPTAARTVADLQHEVQQLSDKLATATRSVAESETRCDNLRQELGGVHARLTAAEHELAVRPTVYQCDQLRQQQIYAENQRAEAESQLRHAQQQLARAEDKLVEAESQLVQAQSQLTQTQQQLTQTQLQLADAESRLTQTTSQLAQTQSQWAQAQSELAESETKRAQSENELAKAESRLAQSENELARLRQEPASVEAQMSQLLQRMGRAAATDNRSDATLTTGSHATSSPHPLTARGSSTKAAGGTSSATEPNGDAVSDVLPEPYADTSLEVAANGASAAGSLTAAAISPYAEETVPRRVSARLIPQPPRTQTLLTLLQASVVLLCAAMFYYCAQRNPHLKVVWYTATLLACGLAMFFLFELTRKWTATTSMMRR